MSNKTIPELNSLFSRRSFLQLAAGTMATIALNPVKEVFAAMPVGRYLEYLNIAIISDLHYYAPELGTTSQAFKNWIATDMKLLADSKNILISAINTVLQSNAQIVLVPGDLTKDGEYLGHVQVANLLTKLTNAGKKVYVINGNHDIYNPNAWNFTTTTPTLVQNTAPSDFQTIYQNFGYTQAIAKDPNSLSYVVEPVAGLQIIAMDSCEYTSANRNSPGQVVNLSNYPLSITAGTFSANTLAWILAQIKSAANQGKTIIGMMHHGIVPHFSEQPVFYPEFVLTNYSAVGQQLSAAGLNVVFTGHFHAQNISTKIYGSQKLIDIETGSLVTYPIPMRWAQLTPDKNKFKITTSVVTNTASPLAPAWDGKTYPNFQTYAEAFLSNLLSNPTSGLFVQQFAALLTQPQYGGYQLAKATAMAQQFAAIPVAGTTLGAIFTAAMISHYQGDYIPNAQTQAIYNALATASTATYGSNAPYLNMLGGFLLSVGNMQGSSDRLSANSDNDLNLNFKTGALYASASLNAVV